MVAIVRIFLLFLVAFPIGNTYAGWFGPSNYEECILDKMKDAKNNYAAAAIANACRKKFPREVKEVSSPKILVLPSDAVARISLVCKEREPLETNTGPKTIQQYMKQYERERELSEHPDEINCTLHNGNNNWIVSNVVVRVTESGSGNYFDNDVGLARYYSSGVGPLSMQDVSINKSMVTGKIRTSIISAKGFAQ